MKEVVKDKKSWSNAIDVIRILAMLMVINLHTFLSFTQRPDFFATKLWWVLEPIVALSEPAVIVFFMLSGYLMLNRQRSIKENCQKTLHRLIIPLVCFELLNVVVNFMRWQSPWNALGTFGIAEIERLLSHPSSPLWFLVVLVFLYLLNPLWQLLFEKMERKSLARYVTFLAILLPMVAFVIEPLVFKNNQMYTSLTSWVAFAGFYLYGGLARKGWVILSEKSRNWILMIGGLLVTVLAQFFTSYLNGQGLMVNYWFDWIASICINVGGIGVGIGLFNILLNVDWLKWFKTEKQKAWWLGGVSFLSGLSFGIYLIHPFVIHMLNDVFNFGFDFVGLNAFVYNILNWTLVFGISAVATLIISKIPGLRRVIGLK